MAQFMSSRERTVVAVRVRPIRDVPTTTVLPDGLTVRLTKEQSGNGGYLKSQQRKVNDYKYDMAFGPNVSQEEVYERTTKPHIAAVLRGFPLTVFAYGATGAGKTHTMMGETRIDASSGTTEGDGLIPLALRDVFSGIEEKKAEGGEAVQFACSVSYMEVYNESVYDLLVPKEAESDFALKDSFTGKPLKVIEDPREANIKGAPARRAPRRSSTANAHLPRSARPLHARRRHAGAGAEASWRG